MENPYCSCKLRRVCPVGLQELKEKVKANKAILDVILKDAGIISSKEIATDPKAQWDEMQSCTKHICPKAEIEATWAGLLKVDWLEATEKVTECPAEILKFEGEQFYLMYAALVEKSGSTGYEGKILVRMSRFFATLFAIFMGFLSVLLNELGLGLGFVYMGMGVMIGSAVTPVAMSILWDKANGYVCAFSAVFGFVLANVAWVIQTAVEFETVDLSTMGTDWPFLVANLVALFSSLVMCVAGSLIFGPYNMRYTDGVGVMVKEPFVWDALKCEIKCVDGVVPPRGPETGDDDASLEANAKQANIQAIILTIFLVVLWPLPMHFSGGVFTEGGFTVWIICAFVWATIGGLIIVILPPLEAFVPGVCSKTPAALKAAAAETEKLEAPKAEEVSSA